MNNRVYSLKRREEAVSPVIATILMVAITVVLAATLYMMVGDIGGNQVGEFFGSMSIGDRGDDYVRVDIDTMSPSSRDLSDITVRLYNPDDDEVCVLSGVQSNTQNSYTLRWTRLSDDDETVDTTSRLWVEHEDDEHDFSGYEVVMTASGRSGSISQEL